MTKLNYERPYRETDAGAVRSVPDFTKPYKPPKTNAERKRENEAIAADEAKRAEAMRPELERQARKEARKKLRNSNLNPNGLSYMRLAEQAAIPEPPRKKE